MIERLETWAERSRIGRRLDALPSILAPLVFLCLVLAFVPFGTVFEYHQDEGLYLMRAALHVRGYAFYKDIWMDQPPGLPLLLSILFKTFGLSVALARGVSLFFSALLLWAVFQMVREAQDSWCALWAFAAIALSSFYVKLSVSAIASIPAISLAVLSLYCAFRHGRKPRASWLVLSGVLFALALLTRFFVAIFLPAVLWEIAAAEAGDKRGGERAAAFGRAGLIWLAAGAIMFLSVARWAAPIDFTEILQPFISANKMHLQSTESLWRWLGEEYDCVVLAAAAFLIMTPKQRLSYMAPAAGAVAAAAMMAVHAPLWSHYRPLLFVNLCWLSSAGLYAARRIIREERTAGAGWPHRLRMKSAAALFLLSYGFVLAAIRLPVKCVRLTRQLRDTLPGSPEAVAKLKEYRGTTRMFVSDRPIYAFYADLPLHPRLAGASLKTLYTNSIKISDYTDIIRDGRPEVLLFARFPRLRDILLPCIENDYRLAYKAPEGFAEVYEALPSAASRTAARSAGDGARCAQSDDFQPNRSLSATFWKGDD